MNTETKHRLLDLREEVNAERDEAIVAARSLYADAKQEIADTHKRSIAAIKAEYIDMYKERKAQLIIENENENEEA